MDDGILLNSSCEVNMTQISKPDKYITREKNHMPMSFVNLDAILENHIQHHLKKTKHHDQVDFIRNALLV